MKCNLLVVCCSLALYQTTAFCMQDAKVKTSPGQLLFSSNFLFITNELLDLKKYTRTPSPTARRSLKQRSSSPVLRRLQTASSAVLTVTPTDTPFQSPQNTQQKKLVHYPIITLESSEKNETMVTIAR